MISQFGVVHHYEDGDISKAAPKQQKASFGRHVTTQVFPGWHGAVAGKPGKKLAAAGSEAGHSIVGGSAGATAGAALGALTRRPGAALAGGVIGGQAGARTGIAMSVNSNQAKGRYKKQG